MTSAAASGGESRDAGPDSRSTFPVLPSWGVNISLSWLARVIASALQAMVTLVLNNDSYRASFANGTNLLASFTWLGQHVSAGH